MQPQLIGRDGSSFALTDEQYQQILDLIGVEPAASPIEPLMTDEEFDALTAEIHAEAATWGVSTDDLLEERRLEREIERNKEKRWGIE